MSNLNNNTVQLEALLAKINALPEAGGIILPTLDNEGVAADLREGKELIDSQGNKITGTLSLDTETNPQVTSEPCVLTLSTVAPEVVIHSVVGLYTDSVDNLTYYTHLLNQPVSNGSYSVNTYTNSIIVLQASSRAWDLIISNMRGIELLYNGAMTTELFLIKCLDTSCEIEFSMDD
jgi:hypothetical protein